MRVGSLKEWTTVRGMTAAYVVVAVGGCLGELGPEVGEPLRPRCTDADTDPATDVSYREDIVDGIFDAGARTDCWNCHHPEGESPIGLREAELDLSSYQALRRGGARSGTDIVHPGAPCESLLLQKVRAGPPVGSRMPFNGPPYLTDREQRLIHDWIAEGAKNN